MELINCLKKVEETRSHINQDYPLLEVVFLVITAMICGYKSWADFEDFGEGKLDWLKLYLPYRNGVPTQQNIARIVRRIVPETLLGALVEWVNQHRSRNGQPLIAIDGKDVRGVAKYGRSNPLSMVSAFDVEKGLVLYHQAGEGKGKEIELVQSLISCLDIKGCILTLDALHCQTDTLTQIQQAGGVAVVQCKSNQPTLQKEVDKQFQAYWQQPKEEQRFLAVCNKGHGREEVRTVYQLPLNLSGKLGEKWTMVESAIAVVRERKKGNKISYETAYFVCTGTLDIDTAMDATRRHWHTENTQHWVLDMTFREDEQRMYAGDSAKNMACFRRFVMNLLRQHVDPKKRSLPRKMNCANHLDDYRHEVLFTN